MNPVERELASLSGVLNTLEARPELVETADVSAGELAPGLPPGLSALSGLELIGSAHLYSRDEGQLQSFHASYWRTTRRWHELELEIHTLLLVEGWQQTPFTPFSTLTPGFRPGFGHASYLRGLEWLTVGLGQQGQEVPVFQASLRTLSVTSAEQLAERMAHAQLQTGRADNLIPPLQPPAGVDPVFQQTNIGSGALVIDEMPLPELMEHYAGQLRTAGWTLLDTKELLSNTLQFWQTQTGELAVFSAVPSPLAARAVYLSLNVLRPPSENALQGDIGWTFVYS